jgi:hypothetical protein
MVSAQCRRLQESVVRSSEAVESAEGLSTIRRGDTARRGSARGIQGQALLAGVEFCRERVGISMQKRG